MNKYTRAEKEILADLADLSLEHGPVELRITTEGTDGELIQEFTITRAPDGVIRGLMEDERIAGMGMEYGEIRVVPAPRRLQTDAEERKIALEDCTTEELLKELWRRADTDGHIK